MSLTQENQQSIKRQVKIICDGLSNSLQKEVGRTLKYNINEMDSVFDMYEEIKIY